MKQLLGLSLFFFLSCAAQDQSLQYAKEIHQDDLKSLLYVYASDYFEGRRTGTIGQLRAADFLRHFYQSHQIEAAKGTDDYYQNMELPVDGINVKTQNVVAIIPGEQLPNEYIILSSHLDHLGMKNRVIFNGADDDGSGTVALLEIAAAFQKAKKEGNGPKRSIIFLHVTGEEENLLGSKYYTDNPLYPLAQTIANLNVDMIGRIDPKRKNPNHNYIYLIGADRLSQELHDLSELINTKYSQLELDYTFNDENDPNNFYTRSDHYNFANKNIPIIFYFNGTHEDYHRASDTPEKINYGVLQKRTQLIFHTAWELANRKNRIQLNQ